MEIVSQQAKVLIVTDDAALPPALLKRWQSEARVPVFLVKSGAGEDALPDDWNLAIVGAMKAAMNAAMSTAGRSRVLSALPAGRPVLCLVARSSAAKLRRTFPHVAFLASSRLNPAGLEMDAVVLLACEMLLRADLALQLERLRTAAVAGHSDVAVGRFMQQVRHSLNNALASVLGNAELLLLESLPVGTRERLTNIHSGALQLHEIMRRMAQLESQIKFSRQMAEVRGERAAGQ